MGCMSHGFASFPWVQGSGVPYIAVPMSTIRFQTGLHSLRVSFPTYDNIEMRLGKTLKCHLSGLGSKITVLCKVRLWGHLVFQSLFRQTSHYLTRFFKLFATVNLENFSKFSKFCLLPYPLPINLLFLT